AARALVIVAQCTFHSDATTMVSASVWAANLAERAGGAVQIAASYGGIGMALGIARLTGPARAYFAMSRAAGEASGDEAGLGVGARAEMLWLQACGGAWDRARSIAEEEIARARRLHDPLHLAQVEQIAVVCDR